MQILQIGVNDAIDELFEFCKVYANRIEGATFVDASIEALNLAKERYRYENCIENTEFINYAVVNDSRTEVEFYYPKEVPTSGHSSLIKKYVEIAGHGEVVSRKVKACTINTLLYCREVDRLYIDVEGYDALLITDIDFEKYKIPFIRFESAHCDGHFTKGKSYTDAINHLLKYKYKIFEEGLDTYAVIT